MLMGMNLCWKMKLKKLQSNLSFLILRWSTVGFFGLLFFLTACNRNNQNYIPAYPVDIFISIDDPVYLKLKNIGGATYVNPSYGGKGMVVYRNGPESFTAVERTCSYRYTDSCAKVNIGPDEIWLECPCCGSKFTFDGQVLGAPATLPLRTYQTYYSPTNNTLRIYQ
jgi:nitrite reductase/ring-hydroxylating ferredoxin subunit